MSSGPSSSAPNTGPVTSDSEFCSEISGSRGERSTLVLYSGVAQADECFDHVGRTRFPSPRKPSSHFTDDAIAVPFQPRSRPRKERGIPMCAGCHGAAARRSPGQGGFRIWRSSPVWLCEPMPLLTRAGIAAALGRSFVTGSFILRQANLTIGFVRHVCLSTGKYNGKGGLGTKLGRGSAG